jgi:hypothetical protein
VVDSFVQERAQGKHRGVKKFYNKLSHFYNLTTKLRKKHVTKKPGIKLEKKNYLRIKNYLCR